MAITTIFFGVLLILEGLVGYYSTGHIHPTALIPTWVGLVLAILGFLANTPDTKKRMLFMHIAVTLGLIGFLGTAAAIFQYIQMLQGKPFPFPTAVESKAAMAVICLAFVLFCVRSFIAARRARA
jgi:uncharacterized membrane protein (UPF0136 family)